MGLNTAHIMGLERPLSWPERHDAAAYKAVKVLPGLIGELVREELLSRRRFNWLGDAAQNLTQQIEALPDPVVAGCR
jgi:hypothetical protein